MLVTKADERLITCIFKEKLKIEMEKPKIVILGGGIMGSSIAYHLVKKGAPSTIIERHAIACAASGKAGSKCDYFFSLKVDF